VMGGKLGEIAVLFTGIVRSANGFSSQEAPQAHGKEEA
jgi:hypothetical protein